MDEKKIARINELYKKKKAGTLTEEGGERAGTSARGVH